MESNLVSVIVPCYNVGKVIHRFLDSILDQSYKSIELILVDDGSTDNTAKIIESYKQTLTNHGIIVKYIYQNNRGLGGAIDTGLKHFTGDFICWPDPDDFLDKYSIEKKLRFLLDNPKYSIVRSDAYIVDESDVTKVLRKINDNNPNKYNEDLFEDYLRYKNVIFCSGAFMIRASYFLKAVPDRSIYPSRFGQNYQMILPMCYRNKIGFIDEPLYYYVVSKNSMSRSNRTYDKTQKQIEGFRISVIETLKKMNMKQKDKERSFEIVDEMILHRNCQIAWEFNKKEDYISSFNKLSTRGLAFEIERVKLYLWKFPKPIAWRINGICFRLLKYFGKE